MEPNPSGYIVGKRDHLACQSSTCVGLYPTQVWAHYHLHLANKTNDDCDVDYLYVNCGYAYYTYRISECVIRDQANHCHTQGNAGSEIHRSF